jgi:hypothetical protein
MVYVRAEKFIRGKAARGSSLAMADDRAKAVKIHFHFVISEKVRPDSVVKDSNSPLTESAISNYYTV